MRTPKDQKQQLLNPSNGCGLQGVADRVEGVEALSGVGANVGAERGVDVGAPRLHGEASRDLAIRSGETQGAFQAVVVSRFRDDPVKEKEPKRRPCAASAK